MQFYKDIEQGTPEWHSVRAGVITASMFATARSRLTRGPGKGELKSPALDYAFSLAVERIAGEPLNGGYTNYAMRRGNELEEDARQAHEAKIDQLIDVVGFAKSDDGFFGASPDGLLGDKGGAEYKCLLDAAEIRAIVLENDISSFTDQIQGGMWLFDREYWHFALYCPILEPIGRELTLHVVERDPIYISKLETDLLEFNAQVEIYREKLIQLSEAA